MRILRTLLLALLLAPSAEAFDIMQLTDNTTDDSWPAVSGSNVVWQYFDGNDDEIQFYNGTTTVDLTNNSDYDQFADIDGSNVVWKRTEPSCAGCSGEEIFFYNGVSEIQVTDNIAPDRAPRVSGSDVVWSGCQGASFPQAACTGGDFDILLWDGSTTDLTLNATNDYDPDIDDSKAVWTNGGAVFLWDGLTTTQIAADGRRPRISGDNVVWYAGAWPYEIFFYDGVTTTQITSNTTADVYPAISGSTIAWQCDDGDDEICYWRDGEGITQITVNANDDFSPSISGSVVVWAGFDGSDTEIFMTDVPEPSRNLMLGCGVLALAWGSRLRRLRW